MKQTALLILLIIQISAFNQSVSVTHVITHNRTTITTNPKTGEKSFPRWGVFPTTDKQVRSIILHLTLATPDSMKTAHWDYCDYVMLRRQGGKNHPSMDLEIGRMLTPYGSMFGKGWSFKWTVDVTDFSHYLRDSVEIEYLHSGYEPDTVGWALTLDFEFIHGPEITKILGISTLWRGHFKYGNPEEKIEEKLLPVDVETMPGSGLTRIRIQHTGHGMDEPRGCSEFCSRWRELYADDRLIKKSYLWKDCGDNPLYPQGGTWIYDRANWCPGDLQQPEVIDITSSPGKHRYAVKMEPYTATNNIQAVENICAYLVHCSKPLHSTDAAIGEILVPNSQGTYIRSNPAWFNPQIILRNLGSDHLTTIKILYGTQGDDPRVFNWRGNLAFNESARLTLPGLINGSTGNNTFEVVITKPNGKKDAWEGDNRLTSTFELPVTLPDTMMVRFKTNKHPTDNTLTIVNEVGDTVYCRQPASLVADSIYNDTLRLPAGKYHFSLADTAGDGLGFWAEPGQGHGYVRFLDLHGRLLYSFQSDCGNGSFLAFSASAAFVRDTTTSINAFSLFPRNFKDKTELEVVTDRPSKLTVIITRDGRVVERHEYEKIVSGTFPFYLGYLAKGRIVLEALLDGKSCFKGRLVRE